MRTPQGSLDPTREFRPPPPRTHGVPLTQEIVDTIGKDVVDADRERLLPKATPWPTRPATRLITLSEKYDTVRSAYIFCTLTGNPIDETLAGKWGKLEGPYKLIEAGHWPMITKPQQLAQDMTILAGK